MIYSDCSIHGELSPFYGFIWLTMGVPPHLLWTYVRYASKSPGNIVCEYKIENKYINSELTCRKSLATSNSRLTIFLSANVNKRWMTELKVYFIYFQAWAYCNLLLNVWWANWEINYVAASSNNILKLIKIYMLEIWYWHFMCRQLHFYWWSERFPWHFRYIDNEDMLC